MPLLSVGFCNETLDQIGETDVRAVVAAERLTKADRRLTENGARITVHQFRRAATHRTQPLDVTLRAFYPALDPATGGKTPFIAWVWRGKERAAFSSHRTAFTVPVDAGDSLHLGVDRMIETPQPSLLRRLTRTIANRRDERAEVAAFDSRSGSNGVPLRSGTYFLAVRESNSDAAPSWSSLRVARTANGLALRTFAGGEPPFSYLVISIDAAKA